MPSRDLVSIRSRDLDHLARRYRELSVDCGKSIQGALNEIATSSTKRMETSFETDIDGVPTNWTLPDPCRFIEMRFGKTMCPQLMSRLVPTRVNAD